MRLALIFDQTRPDTTGVYLARACRQLAVACDHWWLRDAAKMPATYDLYLRIDHGDDYLTTLPNHLRPAMFYAIDTHLLHSWRKIQRVSQRYDVVFCAQANAAQQLRNGEWLPLACDPELHGAVSHEPVWDVAFVGTDGGVPRKFYLQALRERYPNSFLGHADHTTIGSIYSKARVGFNYSVAQDVNMRIFEVLASRTLLMTNRLDSQDLARLGLEDRCHLVLYRSPQELFDLMGYYLARAGEREAIARAGCELVRTRHTYVHRLQQVLASVARRLGVPQCALGRP